jgi:YidC/Oxa1 family membrane protein insertase
MAVLKPKMDKLQQVMAADPKATSDRNKMLVYQQEMKALFKEHKVNPFQAMLMPIIQLPIFISVFMALRDMGNVFPGFSNGGSYRFD